MFVLKTLAAGAAAGFAAGALAVTFAPGVGLLATKAALRQAQADLEAHAASFDESEGLREAESKQCREAVEAERSYWIDRMAEIRARDARFEAAIGGDTGNDETAADGASEGLCGDRRIIPARELHASPDRPSAGPGSDRAGSPDLPAGGDEAPDPG